MIKNLFLSSYFQQKMVKKLRLLLDVEQRYLMQNFNLGYLEAELGVEKEFISQVIQNTYGQSFFELVRNLRTNHLKSLVSKFEASLSQEDYAYFAGFQDVKSMAAVVKQETGLDFDDFCKYAIELSNRNKGRHGVEL